MVSFVTIQGSSHETITLGFDSQSNFVLAEQIAARINRWLEQIEEGKYRQSGISGRHL